LKVAIDEDKVQWRGTVKCKYKKKRSNWWTCFSQLLC